MSSQQIKVPGELISATEQGIIVATNAVKDNLRNTTQQTINTTLLETKDNLDTLIGQYEDYKDAIEAAIDEITSLSESEDPNDNISAQLMLLATKFNIAANAIEKIAIQLGAQFTPDANDPGDIYVPGLKFEVVEEADMEARLANNQTDENTIYFQLESEE